MPLTMPSEDFFDVRLSVSEVTLVVSSLQQSLLLLAELDEQHDFGPQLKAMHQELAGRLGRLVDGDQATQTLN